MVGEKVCGQILFGARSVKPKILFGTRVRNGKIYLVPNDSYEKFDLAVKGLRFNSLIKEYGCIFSGNFIVYPVPLFTKAPLAMTYSTLSHLLQQTLTKEYN